MLAQNSAYIAAYLTLNCCFAAGCQRVPTAQGRLERESAHVQVSSHQLRVMVNEFVVHFADRIEMTADQILAQTSDPTIRRNALLWKINGISSCFQAASRPDPLGAYLDIWILNRQMTHFFHSPDGNNLFGPWQSMACDECRALEERLQYINQVAGGNLPLGEQFVAKFAADFPLTSLYFDREPIASRYIQEVQEPARELFQVVASLEDSLEELQKLSVWYAEHLPKQARWETELLLNDATQIACIQRPLQDFSLTAKAISSMADTTATIPQLVERERHAVRQIVESERLDTLRELERMRLDTLAHIGDERAVILGAVREERTALLDTLQSERIAVTQHLDAEVAKTLQATDSITRRRADELVRQAPHMIDHFFRRIWQVGTAFCVVAVLAALLVFRLRGRGVKTQRVATPVTSTDESAVSLRIEERRRQAA